MRNNINKMYYNNSIVHLYRDILQFLNVIYESKDTFAISRILEKSQHFQQTGGFCSRVSIVI